jgi:hypothetical protein
VVRVTGEHESRFDPWTVAREPNLFDPADTVLPGELFGRDSCVLHDAWVDDELSCGSGTRRVDVRDRLCRRLHRGLPRTLGTRVNDDALLCGTETDHGSCRDGEREHDGQRGLASFVA